MPDIDERLHGVEQRIDRLSERIDEESARMDQRFAQVDQRFAQVDQRFEDLTAEMQKLRVLGEENTSQINLIAGVQAHHGQVLQQLVETVEPLKTLPDLFRQVAKDHEVRIAALERRRRR